MGEALRRSKETEVSLINQNMKMQRKLRDLLLMQQKEQSRQKRRPPNPVSTHAIDDKDKDDEGVVVGGDSNDHHQSGNLPTYYKEKQRPVVIRFVSRAWKKLF